MISPKSLNLLIRSCTEVSFSKFPTKSVRVDFEWYSSKSFSVLRMSASSTSVNTTIRQWQWSITVTSQCLHPNFFSVCKWACSYFHMCMCVCYFYLFLSVHDSEYLWTFMCVCYFYVGCLPYRYSSKNYVMLFDTAKPKANIGSYVCQQYNFLTLGASGAGVSQHHSGPSAL